jgi:hypothetical protein
MRLRAVAAVVVVALAFPVAALAADGYSLFGDAVLASPGNNSPTAVQLSSVGSSFSGIDFDVPAGMTFAQVTNLSTDTFFPTGSSCGGGSPRFQINVSNDGGATSKNIFVYIGAPPSWTGCTANAWMNTGNMAAAGTIIDASQLGGGYYATWASAQSSFGGYLVTGIQLVADSGWLADQVVNVDNVAINSTTYTFEGVATCKNNGWTLFSTAPGPFTNQGQCVSYFSRNK